VTALFHAVLALHFLGLAALLGGAAAQLPAEKPAVTAVMLHGAFTQLATGLALWAIVSSGLHQDVPTAKMAVKIALLGVILGALWSERGKLFVAKGFVYAVAGLAVAEVGVAVFWS
jgi:hypothetical protein